MLGFRRRLLGFVGVLLVARAASGQKCPCVGNGQEPVPCEAAFAADGKCIQDDSGILYPADYGSRCAAHKEPGQASCFDQTTGQEFATVCSEGQTPRADRCAMDWCHEKWCYVDPEACQGVLNPEKLWRRKTLVFSYENCEEVVDEGAPAPQGTPAPAAPPGTAMMTKKESEAPPEADHDETEDETDVPGEEEEEQEEEAREEEGEEEEEDGSSNMATPPSVNPGVPMVVLGLALLCLFCCCLLVARRKARRRVGWSKHAFSYSSNHGLGGPPVATQPTAPPQSSDAAVMGKPGTAAQGPLGAAEEEAVVVVVEESLAAAAELSQV